MDQIPGIIRLAVRLLGVLSNIDDNRPGSAIYGWISPPVACSKCGSEPYIVRWGSIRIGQELDGYYYVASSIGEPQLLCRDCWHDALGIADDLTGRQPSGH